MNNIQLVENKLAILIFLFFLDDLDWCKENIRLGHPTIYVEHVHAGENFQITCT